MTRRVEVGVHLRKLKDSSELRAQILKVAHHGCDHA